MGWEKIVRVYMILAVSAQDIYYNNNNIIIKHKEEEKEWKKQKIK